MTDPNDINRAAENAQFRQDEYFYDHTLKLILGNMVRLLGVRATRRIVLKYTRNLKWF